MIKAILHKAEVGGFWAEVPSLPGCVTQAENMDYLRANLREAIQGWPEAGVPDPPMSEPGHIHSFGLPTLDARYLASFVEN